MEWDCCIHELFEEQVLRTPDKCAVVFNDHALSFCALNERANTIGRGLKKIGIQPGQVIGICLGRSVEMVAAVLGILKVGATYVALDPALPKARLAYILQDAQVALILTQEQFALASFPAPTLCLDGVCLTSPSDGQHNLGLLISPGAIAYVAYTSGSTGKPKAVLSHHRGVVNYLSYVVSTYSIHQDDTILQLAPLSFDASVRDMLGPLLVGAQVRLVHDADARDPEILISSISQHQIPGLLSVVPTMLTSLVGAATTQFRESNSVRLMLVSGEPFPVSLYQRATETFGPQAEIVNQYGPTECTMTSTYHVLSREDGSQPIAVLGQPIPGTQVHVLDKQGKPVFVGGQGEVYIGGKGLSYGYLNCSDATGQVFLPNSFSDEPGARLYKTGDLASPQADGILKFMGRLDDQIKIGGVWVEPEEIKVFLLRHPAIKECVVVYRR